MFPPIQRDTAVGFTKVLPLPTHPKGCCCGVYKGTTSPHTSQGMLLWGLQRYYLSPHIPRDAAVGFTKVLPLPRHPVHPKGCCCRVYKGTTSPQTPCTSQGMLLSGLQRYYLSPDTLYTPRDAGVGFTKVLPLPTHPKGCWCRVYKGTTSPHTPQGMLVSGFTKVLPLPTHPKGCWCRVYKGTTSPHTPQGMLLSGFTKVLPLPTHPKGCCCRVYKGTTSPQTPRAPLCRCEVKSVHGLQSFISAHSEESDSLLSHPLFAVTNAFNICIFEGKFSHFFRGVRLGA